MGGIFISYRREDASAYAGRIHDRLIQHFGDRVNVFIDIDSVNPGADFVDALERGVASCQVVIALLGRAWVTVTDSQGRQRIHNAHDFVRLEIEAGLERNIPVIPVLVGGAQVPKQQDLPETLGALSRRQAIEISDTRFHSDVTRLIEAVEGYLGMTYVGESKSEAPRRSAVRVEFDVLYTLERTAGSVYDVAFSPDGRYLASCGDKESIEIWDARSRTLFRRLSGHGRWTTSLAFARDQHTLVSGGADNTVKIWSIDDGSLLRTFRGHAGEVKDVDVSPTGDLSVSASLDGTVRVWATNSGELLHKLEHEGGVTSVAFDSDGRRLAAAVSQQGVIRLWNVPDGSLLNAWKAHSKPGLLPKLAMRSVAFSPDGKQLASGGCADRTVKIWDATNGRLLRNLAGHTDWVKPIAFSPSSGILASSGDDRTIKLWKTEDGSLLQDLSGHPDWVISLAFSHDGQRLASCGRDKLIKVWQIRDL